MPVQPLGRYSNHRRVLAYVRPKNHRNEMPQACARSSTLSTEELDRRKLSSRHHRMVAGSHHRYAKLRNRRSAALERIVMLAFFTPLGSHGAFPLLGACHVAIGDWVLLSALAGDPPSLIRAISSKHRSVLRNRLYRCISVRALCISHCNRALRACARCSCLATMHNILIVLYFRS